MHLRRLGDSHVDVSAIALGSWLTYAGGVGREQTEACTRAAFEAGITLFDTANVYGRGAAESAWGEILSDYPRHSFILATKLYFPMAPRLSPLRARERGLSGKQIHKQLDASLRRLRTDFVDLYQCHRYDDGTPLEETRQALSEVVQAGKVRCIGFSEWPVQHIRKAVEMPGVARFVSSQPQYSALRRQAEREVMPLCATHGISQIVWSPLAEGVLTGKYQPGSAPPPGSRATSRRMGRTIGGLLDDATLEAVGRLRTVADQAGLRMSQLALAWVLRRPEVASAIIGASRPEQVLENARAAEVRLDEETVRAVDDALSGVASR
jgi:1-deoxyxylulose-5-phosphate synthase